MFGKRLKELREENNMLQSELAQKLSLAPSTISMYERCERDPDTKTLKAIANFFNVSVDYLLGISDTFTYTTKDSKENMQYATYYNDKMKNMTQKQKEAIHKEVDSFADFVINKYFEGKK